MDAGDTRPRRRDKGPTAMGTGDEIDALRQSVVRLEGQVAGLERALAELGRGLGWTLNFRPGAAPSPPVVSPPSSSVSAPVTPPESTPARAPWVAPALSVPDRPLPVRRPVTWDSETQAETQQPIPGAGIGGFDFAAWVTNLGPAKILALVGGGAFLLGMAYFLSLAFSRGWITPEMRVALGLLIGFGMLPAGALLFDRLRPTLGQVVVAIGLATIDLALFASRLYELAPAELALAGALIAAVAAGVIAVRWNSQLVAGMGIAAVLSAPPILSASANLVTVGFLGAVLVGVAYVSLRRDWEWLPWLSFALTALQLLAWLMPGGVAPALVMAVLGGYWALFAVSAVVPVLVGAPRPVPTPILLLGAVSAFTVLAAYEGIDDAWLRGAFIAALALANLVTGAGLARRRGLSDGLAQAALGLAAALYVVAFALALEGPAVPIAWTLAMVVNAWVWARFKLGRAAVVATAIGLLAAGHLLVVDYAVVAVSLNGQPRPEQLIPYADPEGVALAVFLIGLAVVGWLSRGAVVRQLVGSGAALLVAATVPFEATDLADQYQAPMIVLCWTAIALAALAADRLWHPTWGVVESDHPLPIVGALVGTLAVAYLGFHYRLLDWFGPDRVSGTPFANEPSLMTLAVIVALWLLAVSRVETAERVATICLSLLIAGALFGQQLPHEWAVVGWSALAAATLVGAPLRGIGALIGHATAGLLLGAGAVITLFVVAPISRLAVQPVTNDIGGGPPNAATIAIVALAAGLVVATWREERVLGTRWLGIGLLAALVYGLSVGLVDSFAVRVPSPEALEEIGKQAQVALTIMWALVGLGLLGFGLVRDSLASRGAGLALLGLATAKALLYDLSALDIAYRVLSLLGLGVLLLAGAYAYQRLRAKSGTPTDIG